MSDLKKTILADNRKTRKHFDVVAEQIQKDLSGVNSDEMSLIRDQQIPDHEERITKLEEKVALRQ